MSRTLRLRKLGRLRLMLLRPRTLLYQDGYVSFRSHPHALHYSLIIRRLRHLYDLHRHNSVSDLPLILRMITANDQNSWGGKGAKKSKKNPKFLVKTAGIEPALRKDFTTSNVIITEKKDRKAAAFQVKDLPYPYTSIEQFEARFKTPLGSEWNSRGVHQKETMPRVVKKVCPLGFTSPSFLSTLIPFPPP
jgi:hypothetical protein